jgi:hypothetical protein
MVEAREAQAVLQALEERACHGGKDQVDGTDDEEDLRVMALTREKSRKRRRPCWRLTVNSIPTFG